MKEEQNPAKPSVEPEFVAATLNMLWSCQEQVQTLHSTAQYSTTLVGTVAGSMGNCFGL